MNMSKELRTISRLGKTLKILKLLETTLTVGIIAFTVFGIVNVIKEDNI